MTTTIAREIARTLKVSGINDFFMLTGGDQPLWIALRDEGIRMLVARSEASAVYMADGYARARGAPSIAYGQAGPGAANVAAALADAYWAQSPGRRAHRQQRDVGHARQRVPGARPVHDVRSGHQMERARRCRRRRRHCSPGMRCNGRPAARRAPRTSTCRRISSRWPRPEHDRALDQPWPLAAATRRSERRRRRRSCRRCVARNVRSCWSVTACAPPARGRRSASLATRSGLAARRHDGRQARHRQRSSELRGRDRAAIPR